jgi:O-antigen/teichoic acid export membrane protein
MQNSNRQIKIGGIISYLTIGFSIISGLIYTPWMISIIGQSNFGLYTLVTSVLVMVTIDLGLSEAVTRFVSKYRAENNIEGIKNFLGITYKIFIISALIFLLFLSVVYLNLDNIFLKLSSDEIEKVKVLLVIAGFYAAVSFPFQSLDGLLVSGEWFIFQKSTQLFSKVLNVMLMVVALLLGYGLYSLVVVSAISGIIVIALKFFFLYKNDNYSIEWKGFDRNLARELFSFSAWIMVIKLAQRFITNISPSILGITSGSREIAIFSASLTIEGYVYTLSTVLGSMLLPKISQLIYGDKADSAVIQALMIKVGRIQFVMLSGIISIFIMVGRDFFLNWLGTDFEKSYYVAVLLVLPGLITIPQQIASTTLVAINKVKFDAYSRLIIMVISIVLSYFLSFRYGAIGSGIAIFCGNVIGGVLVLNIVYSRILKINVWVFFRKCQLSMAMPFVLVILTGMALNYLITDISWINTIAKITFLFMIYTFSTYFFALNSFEKGLLSGVFKRRND